MSRAKNNSTLRTKIRVFILFVFFCSALFSQKDTLKGRYVQFSKHHLGLDVYSVRFKSIALSYYNIFSSGKWGVKANAYYNFSPNIYFATHGISIPKGYSDNKNWRYYQKLGLQMDLNFFPDYQRRFSYYFGIGSKVTNIDYAYSDETCTGPLGLCINGTENSLPPDFCLEHGTNGISIGGGLNNGLLWRINRFMYADAQFTFGFDKIFLQGVKDHASFLWALQTSVGFSIH